MSGQRKVAECPDCHGQGTIITKHPQFGSLACPSPTQEVECRWCRGTGQVLWSVLK